MPKKPPPSPPRVSTFATSDGAVPFLEPANSARNGLGRVATAHTAPIAVTLASSGPQRPSQIDLWDLDAPSHLRTLEPPTPKAAAQVAALSPDGARLAVATSEKKAFSIATYDTASGALRAVVPLEKGVWVWALAISSSRVVHALVSKPRRLPRILSLSADDGAAQGDPWERGDSPAGFLWDADRERFVAAQHDAEQQWTFREDDPATRTESAHGALAVGGYRLAFAHTVDRYAVGDNGSLELRALRQPRCVRREHDGAWFTHLAFTRDGRHLVTLSQLEGRFTPPGSATLRVWESETGREVRRVTPPGAYYFTDLALTSNGLALAGVFTGTEPHGAVLIPLS